MDSQLYRYLVCEVMDDDEDGLQQVFEEAERRRAEARRTPKRTIWRRRVARLISELDPQKPPLRRPGRVGWSPMLALPRTVRQESPIG
jgi:hypothetical protein